MAKGRGKCPCKCDGMLYVWLVVIVMVTTIFLLTGFTNKTDVTVTGGGPWWAWFLALMCEIVIFIPLYYWSMSFARPALHYKSKIANM